MIAGTVAFMAGIPLQFTAHYRSALMMVAHTTDWLARRGQELQIAFPQTTDHAQARNRIAEDADGEWVFMTDCDHVFDPDIVQRLVTTMEAADPPMEVLSAMYYQRGGHLPVAYAWNDAEQLFSQVVDYPTQGPFRVHGVGGGALLVHLGVFDRIRDELNERPFDNRYVDTPAGKRWLMEDLSFSKRCLELGIPVWCEPRVVSRHLDLMEIGEEHYRAARDAMPAEQTMEYPTEGLMPVDASELSSESTVTAVDAPN